MYISKFVGCLLSPYPSLIAISPPASPLFLILYSHPLYFVIQFLPTPLCLLLHLKKPAPRLQKKSPLLRYASSFASHLSLHTTFNIYLIYRPGQHQVRLKDDMKPLGPTQADWCFCWKGKQFHSHQRTGLGASECNWVYSHIRYSFNSQSRLLTLLPTR